MSSELENRLMQYEKSTPISNDEELIKAIESIIGEEETLPYEKRDFDLIDEAVEAILTLQDVDIGQLEESAERITDTYFNGMQTDKTDIVRKSKAKSVKLKWLIPIAAIVSILAASMIVAYALGYDIIEMTKKAYTQLIERESYEEGNDEIIITANCKEYHSLSEFMENENYETLLLPFDLPDEFSIDEIQSDDYGEYRKIQLFISDGKSVTNIKIKTPATDTVSDNEESGQTIGGHQVNYYQYEGNHQAEFMHEGNYYTVISASYNSLEKIIESLRENVQ